MCGNSEALEPNCGSQLVHNRLRIRSSGKNDSAVSYWKYANAGEYEQGRLNWKNRPISLRRQSE
jgi:hypothetical protein